MKSVGAHALSWARANPLAAWLAFFAGFALVGLALVFATIGSGRRSDLWFEVGRGLIQVVAVVILGAALKLITERYLALTAKAEQDRQFRQDKYDKLVVATNSLRKVPILLEADHSEETWSAQIKDVVDAGLQLRTVKHQIYSSRLVPDPPFEDTAAIVWLFEVMYRYPERAAREFAARKSIEDIGKEPTLDARDACRADLENRIKPIKGRREVPEAEKPPFPEPSWLVYETAETLALEMLTGATLSTDG